MPHVLISSTINPYTTCFLPICDSSYIPSLYILSLTLLRAFVYIAKLAKHSYNSYTSHFCLPAILPGYFSHSYPDYPKPHTIIHFIFLIATLIRSLIFYVHSSYTSYFIFGIYTACILLTSNHLAPCVSYSILLSYIFTAFYSLAHRSLILLISHT